MFKYLAVIIVILAVTAGSFWYVRSKTGPDNVNLWTVQSDLQRGAVLLDVRTRKEYDFEHAMGARHLPIERMQKGDFDDLKAWQKIYVYSHAGARSARAVKLLNDAGYYHTVDLKTLGAWVSLGGSTQKER